MATPLSFARALAASAVLLLAACGGTGAGADAQSAREFEELDADGDDVLEQEEFARAFERFDLDDDGGIEASESPAIVYEADDDRDGVVTPAEFRSIDLSRLAADANLDGRLSRRELERYTRERREQIGPASAQRGARAELLPDNRWLQFRF